jgi:hypothetical protein
MHDDEPVEVYLAANSHHAHFVSNMLADAGIEARVVGEISTLGVRPGEESGPCLWVRRRDKDRARQILQEWYRVSARGERVNPPAPNPDGESESD